ncbi:MAG: phycocyanobilin:ferredoxin oxidoreductase [Synechococcus sp.]
MPSASSPSALDPHPLVDALADRIRCCRAAMPDLAPFAVDPELEAITSTLDGEALFIRNELHQCRGFRKLHLETARLGLGLQILHCVFFPDPRYDLPVFGADIVASPAGISAAIVDLSPVTEALPVAVQRLLASIPLPAFEQVRELPAWGTIFSPYVRFIRPVNSREEGWFVDLVGQYLNVLRQAVDTTTPDAANAPSTIARYQGQLSYCLQQKRNDKTRRVLEKAFSIEWADRYIEELLFDNPPMP